MKKVKKLRVIVALLVASVAYVFNSSGANAEWKQDSNGWWNTEGSSWSVGWKEIDGKWYYFKQDGYMVHDTTIDGYTIGSDGAWIQAAPNNVTTNKDKSFDMDEFKNTLRIDGYPVEVRNTLYKENSVSRGWKLVNGKYYYFSFEGVLAKNETVDGYYLGADGTLDTTKGKSQLQDITMKTEKSVYPVGTEEIRVDITNNTDLESGHGGEYYKIDKFENNEWHNLEFAKHTAFNDLEAILPAKGTGMDICRLSTLKDFNKLTAGKYRILAEIENSKGYSHVTAEFELQ